MAAAATVIVNFVVVVVVVVVVIVDIIFVVVAVSHREPSSYCSCIPFFSNGGRAYSEQERCRRTYIALTDMSERYTFRVDSCLLVDAGRARR